MFTVLACTPGSAPGPTLVIEYGKLLPLPFGVAAFLRCGGSLLSMY